MPVLEVVESLARFASTMARISVYCSMDITLDIFAATPRKNL